MKKALLVGINYPGTSHQLNGCVNDVMEMSKVLSSNFGFKSKNKRMLTDNSATTANIMDRLEWLVKEATPGDVLYFHYSGHGSQFVDQRYDQDYEPDGKDEILCPVDLNWRDKIIKDDDLRKVFNKVPKGVNLTVVLDCCHSGSGMDVGSDGGLYYSPASTIKELSFESSPNKNRLLVPPIDIMNRSIGMDIKVKPRSVADGNTGVLISGCKSNQTSADAWIHNKYMGAATHYLIEALREHTSYKDVIDHMSYKLDQNNYSQQPQLNGSDEYPDHDFLEPFDVVEDVKEEEEAVLVGDDSHTVLPSSDMLTILDEHEKGIVQLTKYIAILSQTINEIKTEIFEMRDGSN